MAILCDSDKSLPSSDQDLKAKGIEVIRWDNNHFTEQAIIKELSDTVVKKVLKLARILETDAVVKAQLNSGGIVITDDNLDTWDWTDDDLRSKIAVVASKSSWFKRINKGQMLGRVIFETMTQDDRKSDFIKKLDSLGGWLEK